LSGFDQKSRVKISARALRTDAINDTPPATTDDLKTMKDEIATLKSESMSAAAEPVHQGEQQA